MDTTHQMARARRSAPAHRRAIRTLAMAAAVLTLAAAGCSSGEESADPTTTAAPPADTGSPSDGPSDGADQESAVVEPDEGGEGSDAEVGPAPITFVTDAGGSWTLEEGECAYTPDSEGPFASLWVVEGTLAAGGGLTLFEAIPADGEGTVIVGTFVDDAADIAYVVIEATVVSDGSTMTVTVGMHDNPLRAVGDPIDLTATVTCSL